MRYQWLAASAVLVGLSPVLGIGVGALGIGCGLVSTWQLVRGVGT